MKANRPRGAVWSEAFEAASFVDVFQCHSVVNVGAVHIVSWMAFANVLSDYSFVGGRLLALNTFERGSSIHVILPNVLSRSHTYNNCHQNRFTKHQK